MGVFILSPYLSAGHKEVLLSFSKVLFAYDMLHMLLYYIAGVPDSIL